MQSPTSASYGMESVSSMNTRQITVMSNQIFEQNTRLNAMHDQLLFMRSQIQSTQIHISQVDGRMPAFSAVVGVLKMLADKINEVVHRVRVNEQLAEEEERLLLADLEAINMELAMGDLSTMNFSQDCKGGANCDCTGNLLCNECFDF